MDTSKMKGWIQLASDVSWEDYGGMWAKKARDGSWYVLKWTNMWDACGEAECKRDGQDQYYCEVKRIYFPEIPQTEIDSALRSCGWKIVDTRDDKDAPVKACFIMNEHDGETIAEAGVVTSVQDTKAQVFDLVLIEACIGYGLGAPLEDFSSNVRPLNLRAKARRYAMECMRDAAKLEERLDRPVNRLGSTAREYGVGDVDSALHRGPFDTAKGIMRKMHGLPPEPTTPEKKVRQIFIRSCPHLIILPEHYREDGTCKCSDPVHRQMMIQKWGYKATDFKDVPLRLAN